MIRKLTPPSVHHFGFIRSELMLHYDGTGHDQVVRINNLFVIFGQQHSAEQIDFNHFAFDMVCAIDNFDFSARRKITLA